MVVCLCFVRVKYICCDGVPLLQGHAFYCDKGDMHPAPPDIQEPTIPPYEEKVGEPLHLKRAR